MTSWPLNVYSENPGFRAVGAFQRGMLKAHAARTSDVSLYSVKRYANKACREPALRTPRAALFADHCQPRLWEWVQIFGDEKLTTVLLDRLGHHAHLIPNTQTRTRGGGRSGSINGGAGRLQTQAGGANDVALTRVYFSALCPYVEAPEKPGLGVDIDCETIEKYRV